MNVLFVCTGNSCRSVMAEYILKKRLKDLKVKDIEVSSAGTSAAPGMPASSHAVELLREYGIDAGSHKARQLTGELVEASDLIFALTGSHREAIVTAFPEADDKCLAIDEKNVPDPIGGTKEVYRRVFGHIQAAIEKNVLPKVL